MLAAWDGNHSLEFTTSTWHKPTPILVVKLVITPIPDKPLAAIGNSR